MRGFKNIAMIGIISLLVLVLTINVLALQRIGGILEKPETAGREALAIDSIDFGKLHKERTVDGVSFPSRFDVLSDGSIYEVYGDGTAELRYQKGGMPLFAVVTTTNLDYLQKRCNDLGGGKIYSKSGNRYCLATAGETICTNEGYSTPQICGGGTITPPSGTQPSTCTFPYSSLAQCNQCGYINRCTSNGITQEVSFANGVCAYTNIGICGDQQPVCKETDNGVDIKLRGTAIITFPVGYSFPGSPVETDSLTDKCVGNTQLYEYSCSQQTIVTTHVSCAAGETCKEGACITSSQPCAQIITKALTKACNPTTKEIKDFSTSCIDPGWTTDLTKCEVKPPAEVIDFEIVDIREVGFSELPSTFFSQTYYDYYGIKMKNIGDKTAGFQLEGLYISKTNPFFDKETNRIEKPITQLQSMFGIEGIEENKHSCVTDDKIGDKPAVISYTISPLAIGETKEFFIEIPIPYNKNIATNQLIKSTLAGADNYNKEGEYLLAVNVYDKCGGEIYDSLGRTLGFALDESGNPGDSTTTGDLCTKDEMCPDKTTTKKKCVDGKVSYTKTCPTGGGSQIPLTKEELEELEIASPAEINKRLDQAQCNLIEECQLKPGYKVQCANFEKVIEKTGANIKRSDFTSWAEDFTDYVGFTNKDGLCIATKGGLSQEGTLCSYFGFLDDVVGKNASCAVGLGGTIFAIMIFFAIMFK